MDYKKKVIIDSRFRKFPANDVVDNAFVFDNPIKGHWRVVFFIIRNNDLSNEALLYMNIEEDANKSIESNGYWNTSLALHNNLVRSNQFVYSNMDNFEHYLKFSQPTKQITWKIYDEARFVPNFGNAEFTMCLEKVND